MCCDSYVVIIDMLLLQDGETALHKACRNGETEMVQCLLTNGANLSAINKVNHKTIFLLIICLKLQNMISCEFPTMYICTYNHIMMNK